MNNNISTRQTEILACFDAIDQAIDHIVDWHKPDYNISAADIKDFRENLHTLINEGGSPEEYFHPIAHGAYKEVYEGLGNWVIKFVSEFNSTAAEKQLLQAANNRGLGWLFAHSLYIDLPVKLYSNQLEDADENECSLDEDRECPGDCGTCEWYRPDEDGRRNILCTVVLQPRGFASNDEAWTSFDYSEDYYKHNPVRYKNESIVPYDLMYELGVSDQSWVQAVIDCYGDENFHRLARFIEDFGLSDLHAGNTGYITTSMGDMPIILDWLSARVTEY